MSTLISKLCERDVPEIGWGKLGEDKRSVFDNYSGSRLHEAQVKAEGETEIKRMLGFEVCEEVSEELARGKSTWHSAWLDSQKKPGLVRSRLVVNQVRGPRKLEDVFAATPSLAAMRFILSRAAPRGHGRCLGLWDVSVAFSNATIEEEVFAHPPKNMWKDKIIWKFLKAIGHWRVHTSVPCVAHNDNEDSLMLLHGDDFAAGGHDNLLDKLDELLGAFEIKLLPRIGPTTGREGVFLHKTIRWNESGFSNRPHPKHVDAVVETVVAGRRETCCNTIHT